MDAFHPSSYGDAFADVYDDWYRDLPGTAACVDAVTALAPRGAVLELGVGTGRLAIPLAEHGLDVVGVDASQAMLEQLRSKPGAARVRTVQADMANPPMRPDSFDVALVAFNTLFNLPSLEAQRQCLGSLVRIVGAHGSVLVETIVFPDTDERVSGVDASIIEVDRVVLTASRLDPDTRSVIGQHITLSETGVRLRPWRLHYLLPTELDALANEVGLKVVSRSEDWNGAPFTEASRHQVVRYCRA